MIRIAATSRASAEAERATVLRLASQVAKEAARRSAAKQAIAQEQPRSIELSPSTTAAVEIARSRLRCAGSSGCRLSS